MKTNSNNKKHRLSIAKREAYTGMFYIAPFFIGTLVFFLYPLISSFILSFGDIDKSQAGFHINIVGIDNYWNAFFQDVIFVPRFISAVKNTLIDVPLVVVFSLIIAIMLNKVTRFSGYFRVVMFLPFLLGTGYVLEHLFTLGVDAQVLSVQSGNIFSREILNYIGEDFVEVIDIIFGRIVKILWMSGVQILLFLSAIQNISVSLYEAARIDGANEYTTFWKITLPMISPILLLNIFYTVITSFTESTNKVLTYIQEQTVRYAAHGFAAAMGWIYFAFVLLLLGAVQFLFGGYMKKNQSSEVKKK